MKLFKIGCMLVLLVGTVSLVGCADGGNTVIEPTETYQPIEAERANAEREAQEREEENR